MPSFDENEPDTRDASQSGNNGSSGGTAALGAVNDSDVLRMGKMKKKKKIRGSNSGGPGAEKSPPPPVPGNGRGKDKTPPKSKGGDGSKGNNDKSPEKKRNSWGFSMSLMNNNSSGGPASGKTGKGGAGKDGGGGKKNKKKKKTKKGDADDDGGGGVGESEEIDREQLMDAGETDGTQDIPEEYRDAQGNFKMMPVPRHLGSLTRRRPPLVAVMGVAGCGKSRLASALMGRGKEKENRAVFRVGEKTVTPKVVVGEELAVLDAPGLPDPQPRISDTYYNDTVTKLRSAGYANAILFVVNQERVTPTLIKNYGLLYRAFNRLDCVKMFVLRRETSFLLLNKADQDAHERESRQTVNEILAAANLRTWNTQQFFMLTAGSGEEQDKQVKYMREQVKKSPRVDISAAEGMRLTTEGKTEQDDDGKDEDKETDGKGTGNGEGGSSSRPSSKRWSRPTSKKDPGSGVGDGNEEGGSSSRPSSKRWSRPTSKKDPGSGVGDGPTGKKRDAGSGVGDPIPSRSPPKAATKNTAKKSNATKKEEAKGAAKSDCSVM
ncbi:unnamed protein product [Pylaiella littoralis]